MVEALRGRQCAARHRPAPELAERAAHRRAVDDDRRRAAVVADRHPGVVGQQRVVGAEQLAHRGGVVDAGVEVGVVADAAGQGVLDGRLRHQTRLQRRAALAALAQRHGQHRAQPAARAGPSAMKGASSPSASGSSQAEATRPQPPCSRARRRSSTWSPMATPMRQGCAAGGPEAAGEGQVLDREVAGRVVGGFDPAAPCGSCVASSAITSATRCRRVRPAAPRAAPPDRRWVGQQQHEACVERRLSSSPRPRCVSISIS